MKIKIDFLEETIEAEASHPDRIKDMIRDLVRIYFPHRERGDKE
jgi:hypothetical protein